MFAEPVKPYPSEMILEILNKNNIEINFKKHPAKNSNFNLENINLVLEDDAKIQLQKENTSLDFKSIGELINYHDIIITPIGSFTLEASILKKPVIALAFGGLGFNFYGDIASKSLHFQNLIREYPVYVAYDLHQLSSFISDPKMLIKRHHKRDLKTPVETRLFLSALKSDLIN